jgi:hypothetical protein
MICIRHCVRVGACKPVTGNCRREDGVCELTWFEGDPLGENTNKDSGWAFSGVGLILRIEEGDRTGVFTGEYCWTW